MKYLQREKGKGKLWQYMAANLGYVVTILLILFAMDYMYAFYDTNYAHIIYSRHERTLTAFVLIISLMKSGRLRLFFLFSLFFSSLIQFLHYQYFGNLVQPISFYQFFCNVQEVTESYSAVIATSIVPLSIVVISFSLAVYANSRFQKNLFSLRFGTSALIIFLLYQGVWTYMHLHQDSEKLTQRYAKKIYPLAIAHSATNLQRSLFCFMTGIVPQKMFGKGEDFPILDPPEIQIVSPARTIVLVIGESLRFDRLSVLGYPQQTTPNLDQLQGSRSIYADWVYSGGTMTKTTVPVLLNRLKYPGASAQISNLQNNLFRLAKKNGFSTCFLSAQSESQLSILNNLIGKSSIDYFDSRTGYERRNTHASKYDDIIFSLMEKMDWTQPSFIVVQQRGSHTPYAKQFPPEFKKFAKDYDNTVLYTDYILSRFLDLLRERCTQDLYFIFVSDHGELLGEKGKHGHGWFEEEVYRVPFIYYADKKNRASYANLLPGIRSQYDISNLLVTLLGYQVRQDSAEDDIYINGSDIDALAGYMRLRVNGKKILSQEIIR